MKYVLEWNDFIGGNPSLSVTTLLSWVALGIVVAKM